MSTDTDAMFIRARGIVQGPYTREQLRVLLRRGQFSRIHEVSPDRITWSRASVLTDLFAPTKAAAAKTVPQSEALIPDSAIEMVEEFEPQPEVAECYVVRNNSQHGPYSSIDLLDWARQGELLPEELVWMPHLPAWMPAGEVPELRQAFGSSAPSGTANLHSSQSSAAKVAVTRSSTKAVVSLTMGLLGWTILPLVGSFVAVLMGHLGLAEIRRSEGSLSGRGAAVAGLALGYSGLAVGLIASILLMVFLFR